MAHETGRISPCPIPAGEGGDCQTTPADRGFVTGFGYWSGRNVRVEFRPAPADSGITFVRADLDPPARIPALVRYRIEVPRRTTLVHGTARVEMVEHVLAALAGLEIDNCEVWVDAPEMPGCDGSSLAFVEAILSAGLVSQPAPRRQRIVREAIRLGDGESWIEARPAERNEFSVEFRLDYPQAPVIGRQTARFAVTPESFARELAPCRTFMLREEADRLRAQGLGSRVGYRDLLVFDESGPIENRLRFDNECARHKALDMVGDLALAGCRLAGHFTAYRGGHRLNAELVKTLLQEEHPASAERKSA